MFNPKRAFIAGSLLTIISLAGLPVSVQAENCTEAQVVNGTCVESESTPISAAKPAAEVNAKLTADRASESSVFDWNSWWESFWDFINTFLEMYEPTPAPTPDPTPEPTAEPTAEPTEEPTAETTAPPTDENTAQTTPSKTPETKAEQAGE
jgi:hypothetical protein